MNILRITNGDRRWYEIVVWWEIRRIPFNIIMYFIGLGSFYIGYVTIPLVYLVIGLMLNVGYTFCWLAELTIIKSLGDTLRLKYPSVAFISYLGISAALVFGFAVFLAF